jgi:hypothetical protein
MISSILSSVGLIPPSTHSLQRFHSLTKTTLSVLMIFSMTFSIMRGYLINNKLLFLTIHTLPCSLTKQVLEILLQETKCSSSHHSNPLINSSKDFLSNISSLTSVSLNTNSPDTLHVVHLISLTSVLNHDRIMKLQLHNTLPASTPVLATLEHHARFVERLAIKPLIVSTEWIIPIKEDILLPNWLPWQHRQMQHWMNKSGLQTVEQMLTLQISLAISPFSNHLRTMKLLLLAMDLP